MTLLNYLSLNQRMISSSSTVVEQLTHHSKVKGLSLDGTRGEKMARKKVLLEEMNQF